MKKVALSYNLNRGKSDHEVEFDSQSTVDTLIASIERKYQCIPIECSEHIPDWLSVLIQAQPDMIFNVAEGYRGAAREAFYPALFEQINLKYTGPGPTELMITQNKGLTKRVLEKSNILLPWSRVLESENDLDKLDPNIVPFPLIVKLNAEGSSMGMDSGCIVYSWDELGTQLMKVLEKFKTNVIIEEYIVGRDISTTFIEGLGSLGPVEYICPGSEIYDFRLKGIDNETIDVISPRNLSQKARNLLSKTTEDIARLLDINSYCRIDFRLDDKENLHFLEVNGQVSFHPIGAFVLAGKEQGYSFDDLVNHIIDFAFHNPKRNSRVGLVKI